jgi:hypothetical protein
MLSSVVTHATRSKVAPAALLELGKACALFQEAAKICPNSRASKFVPILDRLSKKAVQVFEDAARNGAPSIIPNNIFQPSRPDAPNDELSIFSGKTHTLTTKAKPARAASVPSVSSPSSTRSLSDSPRQILTDHPSFAGVHPSLVNELNVFDGTINAQIQNGYYPNGVYAEPMIVQAQHDEQYRMHGQAQAQYEQQLRDEEFLRQRNQELQFRAQQQQQQQQQSEYAYQAQPPAFDPYSPPHGIAVPAPISPETPHSQHPLVHSSSHRSMRQAYHQQAPAQLGHAHAHSQANIQHAAPEMAHRALSHSQSHRSLRQAYDGRQDERPHHEPQYGVPGYKRRPSQVQSPHENGGSSSSQGTTPDAAMYMDDSPAQSPYQTLNPHYWPAPGGYGAPTEPAPPQVQAPHGYDATQDPRQRHRVQLDQHHQQMRQINLQLGAPQSEHYTPDGALRGIAAEDPRLQEHWQAYMAKVILFFYKE